MTDANGAASRSIIYNEVELSCPGILVVDHFTERVLIIPLEPGVKV